MNSLNLATLVTTSEIPVFTSLQAVHRIGANDLLLFLLANLNHHSLALKSKRDRAQEYLKSCVTVKDLAQCH